MNGSVREARDANEDRRSFGKTVHGNDAGDFLKREPRAPCRDP